MVRKSPIRKKLGTNGLPLPSTYMKKHAGLRLQDKDGILRVLKRNKAGALYWAPASKTSPKRKSKSPRRKSPKRKSKSPKRRSVKRKSKSPRRKSPKRRSGKRKSMSPRRKSKSPRRKSKSPRRKSPKRRSGAKRKSPKRKSPKRKSKSPKRKSPKRKSKSPKRKTPKRRSPVKRGTATSFYAPRYVSKAQKDRLRRSLTSMMTNKGGVKKGNERKFKELFARILATHGLSH